MQGGLFVWSEQLAKRRGDPNATLEAFTKWLWSGNGFSKQRYEKLGLERPKPPDAYLDSQGGTAARALEHKAPALHAGVAHGLESLRRFEGMASPHAPGAITNPSAYADPARKSAPSVQKNEKFASLFSGSSAAGFSNPTRKFVP